MGKGQCIGLVCTIAKNRKGMSIYLSIVLAYGAVSEREEAARIE